jgi:hypothetical protein
MTTLTITAAVESEGQHTIKVRITGGKALSPDTHVALAQEVIAMHLGVSAHNWWPIEVHNASGDKGDIEMELHYTVRARTRPGF